MIAPGMVGGYSKMMKSRISKDTARKVPIGACIVYILCVSFGVTAFGWITTICLAAISAALILLIDCCDEGEDQ